MKTNLSLFKKIAVPLFLLLMATTASATSNSDGFSSIFNVFWGTEVARENVKVCVFTDGDSNLGIIGGINAFFCHLEKDMGITAATGTAGVTKVFGSLAIHVEVLGSAGSAAYGGYDHQAQLWICKIAGAVQCNFTSQFNKTHFLQWTYNADKTVNKGVLYVDAAVANNETGQYMNITWDVGTTTTSKTVTLKYADIDTSSSTNGTKGEGISTISGTTISVGMVFTDGSQGARFAASIDNSSNQVGAFYSQVAPNNATSGDTITFSSAANCFTRAMSGGDWTYTQNSGACSAPSVTMPTDSINTMTSSWTSATTILGATWTGLAQNPTSI